MLSRKQYSVLPAASIPQYTMATFLFATHLSDCSWDHIKSLQSLLAFPLPQPSREKDKEEKKKYTKHHSQSLLAWFLHSLRAFIA